MPKVRMLTSMGGFGFNYQPGQIVEVPKADFDRWCSSGTAAPAKADAEVDHTYSPEHLRETATAKGPRETRNVRGGEAGSVGPLPVSPAPSKPAGKSATSKSDDTGM